MEISKHKKSVGLEHLISNMLRGPHFQELNVEDTRSFIDKAGVALHNLPHNITTNEHLRPEQLLEINELDPTGNDQHWGKWVQDLCGYFEQAIPATPQAYKEMN